MASTEKIAIPSSDPDHVVQIPLFDYVKSQRALSKEHLDYQNRSCFDRWETLRTRLLTVGGIDSFALLFCFQDELLCAKKTFRSLEAYNQIWISTVRDRTINCADCLGCRAGLTESCLLIASVLFSLRPGQRSIESFPVRNLSALWYFPVPQTRWNTLVSAILALNPLRKCKLTLMKR